MASKFRNSIIQVALMVALLTANIVFSDDNVAIPTDKSQLSSWFNSNVQPLAQRKNSLDPALVAAENGAQVVKVMKDGSGNFKTITDAINSIPKGNTKRVIVYIGGGNYNEKIKIEREKPFITLYGAPGNMPNLTYGGTALQYGTVDSATLIVESDYFVASNIMISNTELRVLGDSGMSVIVAHARDKETDDTGYSFVHCDITGTGNGTLLGRAWMSHSKVVFAYSNIGSVVNDIAWSNNNHVDYDRTIYFGEYKNQGPGAIFNGRPKYAKQLTDAEAKPFISLAYIQGSKWLLPPPTPKV